MLLFCIIIILTNIEKNMIIAYSDMKIKANVNDPYSTLNPDTSSDSPSAKSKGLRFVSAIAEIKINVIIGIMNIRCCLFIIFIHISSL